MTDCRALTKRKNCRHTSPFEAQPGVPDCINTAMKAVETAGLDPAIDALATDSGGSQLRASNHPVLTSRDPSDH
jgi:hypothetical protein